MSGTSETTFSPSTDINRGQFALCLSKCLGIILDNNISTGFTDVPTNKYYAGAVKWAVNNSLISPISTTVFSPSSATTREVAANAMAIYCDKYKIYTDNHNSSYTPSDCSSLTNESYSNISNAVKWGFMSLDSNNKFNPQSTLSRAQAAVIFTNLYDYYVHPYVINHKFNDPSAKFVVNNGNGKLSLKWAYDSNISVANCIFYQYIGNAMSYYSKTGYADVEKVSYSNANVRHILATEAQWIVFGGETADSDHTAWASCVGRHSNYNLIEEYDSDKDIYYITIYYSPYNVQAEQNITLSYRAKVNTVAHEVFHGLGFEHVLSWRAASIVNPGSDQPYIDVLTDLTQYDYYGLNTKYN